MEFRKSGDRYAIRIIKGEEIVETLKNFCEEQDISAASIRGIGATDDAEIAYFDTSDREYYSREISGDHEIAPLMGNVSTKDGEVQIHIHINLAGSDNKAKAGHLNRAVVSATCEIFLDVMEGAIERRFDGETELPLWDL